ncbi:MAG: LacI family DNA-binding transcriptional regulator [Edaphocola sp.]
MKRVSLKDVAVKAGVSTALVSYVLNGQRKDRINAATAEHVLAVAQELNYKPNYLAQSLKRKKTYNIGLIVADIANPFSAQLARIISNEAANAGYMLMIGNSDEQVGKFKNLASQFADRQMDGLIIAAPAQSEGILQQLLDEKIPVVLVDRYFNKVKAHAVTVNNYDAAKNAVANMLAANRHGKVGIINYAKDLAHLQQRTKGAVAAAAEKESEYELCEINEDNMAHELPKAMNLLLDGGVETFFFAANKLGIAGMKHLCDLGLAASNRIQLTTFDLSESVYTFPGSVHCVEQPLDLIGKKAVERLIEQINNPNLPVELLELPTRLIAINHFSTSENH